ncbi:putative polyribonucleotide nucleotidyltransferase 1, chloroplastic [Artemisia annua]|uniref:Putative polyribonucleotide nucleotidyltransferase 1, chloroplastic n=1 Tax=Artemisia annua TaxID=35608 RepID=A0A2U1LA38_ARTAN|nr:putative polyribonucleotide nucleotidyltransferase 1, chloroplastic [Artemisia annua]
MVLDFCKEEEQEPHIVFVRCGSRSFHLQKNICSACAYPAARVLSYDGLTGDKVVVNGIIKEMEDSKLDLMLAGSESEIFMIEGYCDFLPKEKLVQAPLAKASAPSLLQQANRWRKSDMTNTCQQHRHKNKGTSASR